MSEFDLGDIEVSGAPGIDALFQREASTPQVKTASHRMRVASLKDLSGFTRTSAETLIHKSNRDLWALKKDSNNNLYVERLFDDNGSPLKG